MYSNDYRMITLFFTMLNQRYDVVMQVSEEFMELLTSLSFTQKQREGTKFLCL